MAFRPPAEQCPRDKKRNVRRSIRPDIPMSPKASSMSDEADTLDRSHLHGLKGAGGQASYCARIISTAGIRQMCLAGP